MLITVPPYLSDYLTEKQTGLHICQHMVRDKMLIVDLHEELIRNPKQYNLDIDKDQILGF